jgi:hypothetical protein
MNPEPDFTAVIQRALRESAEREAAEAALAAAQFRERRRLLAMAEESLTGLVAPILEAARSDLHDAGLWAEIGNGRDRYGCLRLSLRIAKKRQALVFTACDGLSPYLGSSLEPLDMASQNLPTPIAAPSGASIQEIIGHFIASS